MRTYIGAAALVIAAIIASLAAFAGNSYADHCDDLPDTGTHTTDRAACEYGHVLADIDSKDLSGGDRVYAIHWDHAHPAQRTCGSLPGYSGGPDVCVPIS